MRTVTFLLKFRQPLVLGVVCLACGTVVGCARARQSVFSLGKARDWVAAKEVDESAPITSGIKPDAGATQVDVSRTRRGETSLADNASKKASLFSGLIRRSDSTAAPPAEDPFLNNPEFKQVEFAHRANPAGTEPSRPDVVDAGSNASSDLTGPTRGNRNVAITADSKRLQTADDFASELDRLRALMNDEPESASLSARDPGSSANDADTAERIRATVKLMMFQAKSALNERRYQEAHQTAEAADKLAARHGLFFHPEDESPNDLMHRIHEAALADLGDVSEDQVSAVGSRPANPASSDRDVKSRTAGDHYVLFDANSPGGAARQTRPVLDRPKRSLLPDRQTVESMPLDNRHSAQRLQRGNPAESGMILDAELVPTRFSTTTPKLTPTQPAGPQQAPYSSSLQTSELIQPAMDIFRHDEQASVDPDVAQEQFESAPADVAETDPEPAVRVSANFGRVVQVAVQSQAAADADEFNPLSTGTETLAGDAVAATAGGLPLSATTVMSGGINVSTHIAANDGAGQTQADSSAWDDELIGEREPAATGVDAFRLPLLVGFGSAAAGLAAWYVRRRQQNHRPTVYTRRHGLS